MNIFALLFIGSLWFVIGIAIILNFNLSPKQKYICFLLGGPLMVFVILFASCGSFFERIKNFYEK